MGRRHDEREERERHPPLARLDDEPIDAVADSSGEGGDESEPERVAPPRAFRWPLEGEVAEGLDVPRELVHLLAWGHRDGDALRGLLAPGTVAGRLDDQGGVAELPHQDVLSDAHRLDLLDRDGPAVPPQESPLVPEVVVLPGEGELVVLDDRQDDADEEGDGHELRRGKHGERDEARRRHVSQDRHSQSPLGRDEPEVEPEDCKDEVRTQREAHERQHRGRRPHGDHGVGDQVSPGEREEEFGSDPGVAGLVDRRRVLEVVPSVLARGRLTDRPSPTFVALYQSAEAVGLRHVDGVEGRLGRAPAGRLELDDDEA